MSQLKTVQEWLYAVNIEELINTYMDKYADDMSCFFKSKEKYGEFTVDELHQRLYTNLRDYIVYLKSIEPIISKEMVLLAYKYTEDGFSATTSALFNVRELKENYVTAVPYGYEFQSQPEILGFLVANTKYTKKHILELLSDVLYEASFFGYKQENLEETLNDIKKAEDSIKEGTSRTFTLDELKADLGLFDMEEDLKEEELSSNVFKAVHMYNNYCREKEILEFLSVLK